MNVARAVAAAGLALALEPASALAASRRPLLDVPFLAQSEDLCGGAAVSMVLRYWGGRDVFPQDFASLVDSSEGGIPTRALVTSVRDRGWQAFVVPAARGDEDWTQQIESGRPLIALVRIRPSVFHYVVIVGLTPDAVVVHDPAAAPFRVLPRSEFDAMWTASGRWLLLILPADPTSSRTNADAHPETPLGPASTGGACDGLVDRGIAAARAGDIGQADRQLTAATALCSDSAAGWRELGGLRFAASQWREAAALADRATKLAPDDEYAWTLLATSRYLAGDQSGALEARGHLEPPPVDVVTVEGARRTRQPVVVDAVGLEPREGLTADALARARHRLAELPVFTATRLRYTLQEDGTAGLTAIVREPPVFPHDPIPLAALGVRPLFLQEVRLDLAGPAGDGERWTLLWRWPDARRRIAGRLAAPAPGALPGIVTIEGEWERQTYRGFATPLTGRFEEERRRGAIQLSDWATGWLRWQAGGALDRFGDDAYTGVELALDGRFARDRTTMGIRQGSWLPVNGGRPFHETTARAGWRSTAEPLASRWMAIGRMTFASREAPFAVWPGAGAGQAREALVRAHPLLDEDVVQADRVFGRALAAATVSYEHPIRLIAGASLGVAGFLDAARAWHRVEGAAPSIWEADAGAGFRVHAPGLEGVARLDVAVGLRDGRILVSAGWAPEW